MKDITLIYDNPDVEVVSEIMKVAYCDQENWFSFCKLKASLWICNLNAYSYYPYYKQTMKLY